MKTKSESLDASNPSMYHNFRPFTYMADYLHRPIIAYGEKKSQQITHTGG